MLCLAFIFVYLCLALTVNIPFVVHLKARNEQVWLWTSSVQRTKGLSLRTRHLRSSKLECRRLGPGHCGERKNPLAEGKCSWRLATQQPSQMQSPKWTASLYCRVSIGCVFVSSGKGLWLGELEVQPSNSFSSLRLFELTCTVVGMEWYTQLKSMFWRGPGVR